MANLDTASKRASSMQCESQSRLALVFPDGTITQPDRQQSAWSYSGILAAGLPFFRPAWASGSNVILGLGGGPS